MNLRWSVLICTHNRALDLQATLPKLALLDYAANQFEIIVVDNGSTDNTPTVVEMTQKVMTNLLYVKEEKLGLSHARNRGILAAGGEFIAFIDDDAWPEANWLQKLEECFKQPRVACVGGMVKPYYRELDGWPEWLHPRLIVFFGIIEYPNHRDLHYPGYPAGTNIAFRRDVLTEVGVFNAALGRTGRSLLSGEESELCLRIEEAGYGIRYTPEAVVHHKVHANRLTKEWVKQRIYWQGISSAVIEGGRFKKSKLFAKILKSCVFIVAGLLGNIIFKFVKNERLAFACVCQVILCKAYIKKVMTAE